MRFYVALSLGLISLIPGASWAGDCAGALTAEQIRACLAPPLLTRGLSRQTRGITINGDTAAAAPAPSVDLTVNFEFNSARLSNDGMISLDSLGQALSDPSLRDERFQIAGHTDAVGSDDYNQKLSEARALSVRDYLTRTYRMNPSEFDVVGYGKTRLYDPADPTAAINRRVQITKLAR